MSMCISCAIASRSLCNMVNACFEAASLSVVYLSQKNWLLILSGIPLLVMKGMVD